MNEQELDLGLLALARTRDLTDNGIRHDSTDLWWVDNGEPPPQILHAVQYTDNQYQLHPQIARRNGQYTSIDFAALGRHKNTYWEFQDEWRYVVHLLPIQPLGDPETKLRELQNAIRDILNDCSKAPADYLFLTLNDSALIEMEVTMGARLSLDNRIMLERILTEYAPDASLASSQLEGRI